MLAKLGQMEASEATQALTSTMKGYQKTVAETEGIVDSFAAVDMRAAVSAGYLATAMSKTAVGAKSMGIDFDTLTAAIASVGEVTQESAEVTGNFFKTMIARMGNVKAGNLYDPETAESLSDVETVLQGAGIALRQTDGEFRNFWEVLKDVNAEWDNWGTVQKKAVSVAFSGTRQQERFLVLMENFDRILELSEVSASSSGTAIEKYGAYLDSITASVESFKAAVYDFSDSFIDSDLVEGVIDFGTIVVETATKILDSFGAIPSLAALIGGAKLASTTKSMWSLAEAAGKSGTSLKMLQKSFKELGTETLSKALGNAEKGMSRLGSTASLVGSKIMAALPTVGVLAFASVLFMASQRMELLKKKTEEMFAELGETDSEIAGINSEISEVSTKLEAISRLQKEGADYSEEELTSLQTRNAELRTKLGLLEEIRKIENTKAVAALDEEVAYQKEGYLGLKNNATGNRYMASYEPEPEGRFGVAEWLGGNDPNSPKSLGAKTLSEDEYIEEAIKRLNEIKNQEVISPEEQKEIESYRENLLEIADSYIAWADKYESRGEWQKADEFRAVQKRIAEALLDKKATSDVTRQDDIKKWVESLTDNPHTVSGSLADTLGLEDAALKTSVLLDETSSGYAVLSEKATEYGMTVTELIDYMVELGYVTRDGALNGTDELIESFQSLQNIVSGGGDALSLLKNEIDRVFDWRSTTDQVNYALEEIRKLTGIKLDINADGTLDTLQLLKSYIDGDSEAFENFAKTVVESLGIKPQANGIRSVITSLIENFGKLEGAAKATAAVILSVFESVGALTKVEYDNRIIAAKAAGYRKDATWDGNTLYDINEDWFSNFDTKKSYSSSSSSGGSGIDTHLEKYKSLVAEIDHLRAMDLISEEEYYRRLEALADKYLRGKSKYLDEYRSVQEQLWAYQKELWEKQRDDEIAALEDQAEAQRDALEDRYEAEREALEKRKDLLDEEKDAYKDLIDKKKELLDDADSERTHNQRVDELNREMADIEAELAALSMDDSEKANARRIQLQDELLEKKKALEEEQWDWSIENQKDALDEEYERYEKLVDEQTKLLDDQLEALGASYDAQMEAIDNTLEASIKSVNSYFDALLTRANDVANQIDNIFNRIYSNSKSGVMELQGALVGAGYDIGDYGSNNDGIDGIFGSRTKQGLVTAVQELIGAENLPRHGIDGKWGSETRDALNAAINAGRIDPSIWETLHNFGLYHRGGVVGEQDKDVFSKLLPVGREEILAKLLKGEVVLTERHQEMMRSAFEKMAAMIPISNARVSNARVSNAGTPTSSITITNVFEGNVDPLTIQRLENWGAKFKKDIFGTMNKHSKLVPKSI